MGEALTLSLQYLAGLVDLKTDSYLDEFQERIMHSLNKEVSLLTLCHALRKLNITNKKVSRLFHMSFKELLT
jgi:hypothetical protein